MNPSLKKETSANPVPPTHFAQKGRRSRALSQGLWVGVFLTLLLSPLCGQEPWAITSLNCYWFMDETTTPGERGDAPTSSEQKSEKAQALAKLVAEATNQGTLRVLGLQEIGNQTDIDLLAQALEKEGIGPFETLFKPGRDTYTGQNVGALIHLPEGWKLLGQASRDSDLEKALSKHLTFTLQKGEKKITFCVVHLRVPKNPEAKEAHAEQYRALLRYAARHLKEENSNLIILGDFNEPSPPGETGNINILLTRNLLQDTSDYLPKEKQRTHQKVNRMLDRVLTSQAVLSGKGGIKALTLEVFAHDLPPKTGTDHYPVTLLLEENLH